MHDPEGSEYDRLFYPYLFEGGKSSVEDVLAQVRHSTLEKCREVIALRRATLEHAAEQIALAGRAMARAFAHGALLLAFGNGGSTTDAQDFVADLLTPLFPGWLPLPAIALTNDIAVVTAVGNDVGFDNIYARQVIALIARLSGSRPLKFMEVCGGHTHTIYKHGIEDVLPPNIDLVHGPGCPVCVLPMGRIDDAIAIARMDGVIFTTFGDMMRVPGSHGSLLDAKADGADVRFVYSPLDALKLARQYPDRKVVFFAIGFETTDTYVVSPLFFPGGDIGKLAVHGTINDLSMAGAEPLYLSVGLILEEGFPIADLRKIIASMAQAASEAGVSIVTGDTKVVQRGKADGVFINTAGVGLVRASWPLGQTRLQPGDRVLLSGPIGDHGIAIMMARESLDIETDVQSDTAPLNSLVAALLEAAGEAVHCLKDPTRGGVATSLNEMALGSEVSIGLDEYAIPVHAGVRGACEILGLDPIANEGKLLAIVAPEKAEAALVAMRSHPLGREAAIIGTVQSEPPGMVFLRTDIGGMCVLDMLIGDPLPRIC